LRETGCLLPADRSCVLRLVVLAEPGEPGERVNNVPAQRLVREQPGVGSQLMPDAVVSADARQVG
jgi:hypothetical protein